MFLTTPSLDELKQADLSELIDMLAEQTLEYKKLFRLEGVTTRSIAIKELIENIQLAIESKKSFHISPDQM